MILNIIAYTLLFCTFNKKNPLKWVYKETTYTFFYDAQIPNLKKKNFFRNVKSKKIGIPKKKNDA